jgi:DNA-binding phage protein
MTTRKSFRETVAARAANDLNFRYGLLTESLDAMLSGDLDTGKSLLRDYINATTGFENLAEGIGKSPKSLMRMLSASGNPTAKNLFGIVSYLQQAEGVSLQTQAS